MKFMFSNAEEIERQFGLAWKLQWVQGKRPSFLEGRYKDRTWFVIAQEYRNVPTRRGLMAEQRRFIIYETDMETERGNLRTLQEAKKMAEEILPDLVKLFMGTEDMASKEDT